MYYMYIVIGKAKKQKKYSATKNHTKVGILSMLGLRRSSPTIIIQGRTPVNIPYQKGVHLMSLPDLPAFITSKASPNQQVIDLEMKQPVS